MKTLQKIPGYNNLVNLKNTRRATLLYRAKTNDIIKKYLASTSKPKLQIGCGNNFHEGWLNTDRYPSSDQAAFLDASKVFPFKDETFDFIYSEHIFEHLTFKESSTMISECWRVLKPNGVMRLATPSADFLFDMYRNPDNPKYREYLEWSSKAFCTDMEKLLEGKSENLEIYVINNFYRAWGHKVIHNFNSLKELVLKLNFSDVQKKEVGSSQIEELCNLERHGNEIPEHFNKLETLIIEAKKS
ncbi:class I SAM-dependent methyltransferase [Robiginitalea sp.]|uniref:class I SAM-dependent methyltransferase n=1 Tax=Robiginitalea sp. TaxID=1902411 RepID=UPI003C718DC5